MRRKTAGLKIRSGRGSKNTTPAAEATGDATELMEWGAPDQVWM
jgi:hypothetical protein